MNRVHRLRPKRYWYLLRKYYPHHPFWPRYCIQTITDEIRNDWKGDQ